MRCCSRIVTFTFCLLSLVRTDPCWGKARKLGLKEKPCPQSTAYEGFLGTLLFVCSCPVPLGSAASNWVPRHCGVRRKLLSLGGLAGAMARPLRSLKVESTARG